MNGPNFRLLASNKDHFDAMKDMEARWDLARKQAWERVRNETFRIDTIHRCGEIRVRQETGL